MAQADNAGTRSRWGRMTIAEDGRHTWRPTDEIANDVYTEFEIAMDCVTGRDGSRRFTPSADLGAFVLTASLGGLAILAKSKELGPDEQKSYHFMRLIFQRAPCMREHLNRSFTRRSDLWIGKVQGVNRGWIDVLPDQIGLDPNRQGKRWTVSELIRRGRDSAVKGGDLKPSQAQCIAAGLLEAARLAPLDPNSLSEAESRGLVRGALFAAGPADVVDELTRQRVKDRLIAALSSHLEDETEAFNRWFFENGNELFHQIAKQVKNGGKIDREVVRNVFLDLVFDAYTYIAGCFCYQMQAFVQALPAPLDARERAWFEALYFNQPYLGGLPLVLLRDRFDFLKGAALEVMAAPEDPGTIGVLLRLLNYYEEMVTKRRDADAESKRQSDPRDQNSENEKRKPLDLPSERKGAVRQTVFTRLREDRRVSCTCADGGSWSALQTDQGGDVWSIALTCNSCGYSKEIEADREELEQILRDGIASTSPE
jgi:hypothetical protein